MNMVENSVELFQSNGQDSLAEKADKLEKCCDRHYLINSSLLLSDGDNTTNVSLLDLNATIEAQNMRIIVRERDQLIRSLERENMFLREQVNSLNLMLDQLTASTKSLAAAKNDIRIKVENSTGVSMKKWYTRPKVVLTGSAIAIVLSLYLKYKIRNW